MFVDGNLLSINDGHMSTYICQACRRGSRLRLRPVRGFAGFHSSDKSKKPADAAARQQTQTDGDRPRFSQRRDTLRDVQPLGGSRFGQTSRMASRSMTQEEKDRELLRYRPSQSQQRQSINNRSLGSRSVNRPLGSRPAENKWVRPSEGTWGRPKPRKQTSNAKAGTFETAASDVDHEEVESIRDADDDRRPGLRRSPAMIERIKAKKERRRYEPKEEEVVAPPQPKQRKPKAVPLIPIQREAIIPDAITVANLARVFGVRFEHLVNKMHQQGLQDKASYDYVLTADDASMLAMEFNLEPVVNTEKALDVYPRPPPADPFRLPLRPPVVTIMGHVDHGKTTLLDSLRRTSVAAGEAGGITQHIGAFSVSLNDGKNKVTFLDTPGHAAFTNMRSRGANVTDIVVLVVAADDGVMPQTREAIKLATEADVPMIVAINKMDKPGCDAEKVAQMLLNEGIQLETNGGDIQVVPVSGLTGDGLDKLVDNITTLAEVLDLRAEKTGKDVICEGTVIESKVDRGKGTVSTMLVRRGTLNKGDVLVAGTTWCKVRTMVDDKGAMVNSAEPGTPVNLTGWRELPSAGDEVLQVESEDIAKRIVENRKRRIDYEQQLKDIEAINEQRRMKREEDAMTEEEREAESKDSLEPSIKELCLLVKGDVSGTVEAVVDSMSGLGNKQVHVKVVGSGVGAITESDVQMASATGATIIGFNARADKKVSQLASSSKVEIISHSIIYRLLEDTKARLATLLPPVIEKHVHGEATVQQLFPVTRKGTTLNVAGCRITNGSITRQNRVRIVRDRQEIFDGELSSLRHVKKDIPEAKKGMECGMDFAGFQDFLAGDIVQSYVTRERPAEL